jgi:hypothetical protein
LWPHRGNAASQISSQKRFSNDISSDAEMVCRLVQWNGETSSIDSPIESSLSRTRLIDDQMPDFRESSSTLPTMKSPPLARDKATQIRPATFKKPIFPCSLDRTKDNKIMSFSSPWNENVLENCFSNL